MSKETSARVAKLAAAGLKSPRSLTLGQIKEVCASALAQREADLKWPTWKQLLPTQRGEIVRLVDEDGYMAIRKVAMKRNKAILIVVK